MNMNEFAKEVHENAVAHGFYDPAPSDAETIALIHSEISEALQEWRAGQPMVWYECDGPVCIPHQDEWCAGIDDETGKPCPLRDPEPRGIAVELIDVALRILDAAAAWGEALHVYAPTDIIWDAYTKREIKSLSLPELATFLHRIVAEIDIDRANGEALSDANGMGYPISLAFTWLRALGIDPEALMLEKHNYNKTRPYRHGGKRI